MGSGTLGNSWKSESRWVNSSFIGPEPFIPLSLLLHLRAIRTGRTERFKTQFFSLSSAKQARSFISLSDSCSRYYVSTSRSSLKRLTECLTGHSKLNKHSYAMGLWIRPNSKDCDEPETGFTLQPFCISWTWRAGFEGSDISTFLFLFSLPSLSSLPSFFSTLFLLFSSLYLVSLSLSFLFPLSLLFFLFLFLWNAKRLLCEDH